MEVYAETKNGNVINIDSLYSKCEFGNCFEENLPENIRGEIKFCIFNNYLLRKDYLME